MSDIAIVANTIIICSAIYACLRTISAAPPNCQECRHRPGIKPVDRR